MDLLGLSKNNESTEPSDSGIEDDDSDYNKQHDDCNTDNHDDDDMFDEYFLSSHDFRTYGDPHLQNISPKFSTTGSNE